MGKGMIAVALSLALFTSPAETGGAETGRAETGRAETGAAETGAKSGVDAGTNSGVFILGVDGMDPVILDRMIGEGRMPEFARLAREGTYQRLGTSTPPQSPVAWSSFVTGTNPGGHGIFDFVHRDPKTYQPISSATKPVESEPSFVRFFGYVIPLGGDVPENNRGAVPFWDILVEHNIDTEVYRIPANFPSPVSDAKVLAGMGTVDMRGGYGTYTWYTSKPIDRDDPKGDIQVVTVDDFDLDGTPDTASGVLKGPPDLFHLEPGQAPGPTDYLTVRVVFNIDPEHDTVLVRIDDDNLVLARGEWSDWVEVNFDALPMGLYSFAGIVRFYVKEVRPNLQIYASPVNISPADPSQPISSPENFAVELYESLGHYFTKGLPEQTDALKDGTFDDDDYLSQVALVQHDTESMLELALKRFSPGDFTFMYVSDLDLQCHMLWRHGDPKDPNASVHPAFEPHAAHGHEHAIEMLYENVDRLLGKTRAALGEDNILIVMSDHGFARYARKVHLNAWLRDQGYLVLKDGKKTGSIAGGDVDWSKTRAYALGFNGLYLNLAGREAQGIVAASDKEALQREVGEKLRALLDPQDGVQVVHRVDYTSEVYSGPRKAEAPDIIVGYNISYGGSDSNTLGEINEPQIEDNESRWSGNHLMAPDLVPGVLLSNRKLAAGEHNLTDVTVSILEHFGIGKPKQMVGHSFLQEGRANVR
ncbi:MAG: hypothetical protein A2289_23995 [Deltaproteobacteria bacterium RIFOXYA12_FULL_58_15]|nr:MAG: hypothetical protein A2289_23995 [Deltaproteobacteria bacterium RIFOXYA12_FULL_58_15]